jgi:UDP-N-acetylglucosamine 4-epimerase
MYAHPYHPVPLQGYTFLVTGAAGFIGSNLVGYLLHHGAKRVIALDNLSNGHFSNIEPYLSDPRFEWQEGDILDMPTCQRCCAQADYVLHQAALGSVPRSIKDPVATNQANVTGFLNMLTAAKDAGVKRFVYASSSSVYGDHPQLPKREEAIGNALSPYAVSKRVNELYAQVFFHTYGFPSVGLRYFNVFGPKQSPEGAYAAVIPLFAKAMIQGHSPQINGDGLQTRDFTYVENVIQANIKALFAEHPEAVGQVYNIGTHGRISLLDLVEALNEALGTQIAPQFREPRAGDIRDSFANIDKARALLGYEPRYTFIEGLRLTASWYQSLFA